MLSRIERDAFGACALMALVALIATHGRLAAAAGVVAGGALIGISYWGIKDGITTLLGRLDAGGRARLGAFGLVKFFTRWAILAAVAYVILARLRLTPPAVFAGASSMPIAVAVEALRSARDQPRGRTTTKHPSDD